MKRVGDKSYGLLSKKQKHYNEDAEFIDYLQFPTLQNISIACIAISLWTKSDTIKEVERFKNEDNLSVNLGRLEKKCIKKLDDLSLSSLYKAKISHYVRPIILELLKCNGIDGKYMKLYDLLKIGDFLHWTVEGTINMAKSLEALINSKEKDIVVFQEDLYHFACLYCLEDYIPKIRSKLPPKNCKLHNGDYRYHIDEYWNAVQTNQLPQLIEKLSCSYNSHIYDNGLSLYQNMVTMSIYTYNKSALSYFWPKLTNREKRSNLKKWLELASEVLLFQSFKYQLYYEGVDNLFFLISHLKNGDQQKKFFSHYPLLILKSTFFAWPYQRFFLPTIRKIMNYIRGDVYNKIIACMFIEVKRRRITSYSFREIWQISPLRLKTKFIRKFTCDVTPIGDLISVGDSGTALMILKDASYQDCKSLLFCILDNILLLTDIISSKKLNLLNEVLSKTLTPDDVNIFKEHIASNFVNSLFYSCMSKGDFLASEEFLDWCYQSPQKVNVFKESIMKSMTLCADLIYCCDYENYSLFMKWFFQTEEKVNQFKRSSLHKFSLSIENEMLNLSLHDGKHAWARFKNFVDFNTRNIFTSRQISKFKTLCLESIVSLLKNDRFQFALHLVNWCLDSIDKVIEFKNKLFNSDAVRELLIKYVNSNSFTMNAKDNFFKWFSPLKKTTVKKLKDSLSNKFKLKRNERDFFQTLDFFANKYDSPDCICDFEDDYHNKGMQTERYSNEFDYCSVAYNGKTIF